MNIETTFTLITFIIMLYYIKFYYDKYASTSIMIDNFLKEIEFLNKEITKHTAETTNFDLKLNTLNQKVEKYKIIINTSNQEVEYQKKLYQLNEEALKATFATKLKEEKKKAREDAISRSRSVIRGQATEHLAPFIMEDTNPKDCRFLGSPIDYIVFDGLSDVIDKTANEINEIKFIDVKTGKSSLNTAQRRIRDAIISKKVSFHVVNPDKILLKQAPSTQENTLGESN